VVSRLGFKTVVQDQDQDPDRQDQDQNSDAQDQDQDFENWVSRRLENKTKSRELQVWVTVERFSLSVYLVYFFGGVTPRLCRKNRCEMLQQSF